MTPTVESQQPPVEAENTTRVENEVPPFKSKVTVVGSGNWGSVAAKLIASNTRKLSSFHDEVRMWVFEETLPTGEKLSEVINQTNENVKYLPGIKLGENVVADPDLENAVRDANMLVFVTPHQFMEGICRKLVGKIREDAEAISLIKGMEVKKEGPCMISTLISEQLGINCCVLMGANIANEIAVEKFSEATVGYRKHKEIAEKWVHLFNTSYFMVSAVQDVEGVELCGTLKNVVAIAAGFVDGLEMGNNTKAAIMRIGLREMKAFSKLLFHSVKDTTYFESCGIADLITTCLGGRNRKCAEAFARNGGKRSFDELEAEMLQGQKLQGVSTAKEVYEVLSHRGWLELFPLFSTVHEICIGHLPPSAIVEYSEHTPKFSLAGGRLKQPFGTGRSLILQDSPEISRDMTAAIENGNIGPDFFGFYTSEVAELLSQDDDFVPFLPQISGLAGNLLELDRDKSISKNSCIKKENSGISGSTSLYTNGIGSLLPDFKMERLRSLLCESVLTLGQEINEMIDPVISICRIQSCLRYKNSLLTFEGSGCEIDQVEHPQKKLKVSPPTLDSENEHVHLDVPGKEVSNDVKKSPQLWVGSDRTKIDGDLRYILESDSTKVEELMKKYSDELSTMICHMEQKLEELLDIVMSSCRPMNLRLFVVEALLIQSLPPGNLDRVAEIIRHRNPSKNTSSDEIRVDLDDEDIVTLWRLYYYVTAVEKARTLCEDL
ncbi:unnamed protein product [Fraxinus pennsylvanica]|uniref:Glycerol-3-phosphate dehydrogenase [NAD(+)] n=1 Tax=Fraxinus pennsylvanica TaxID=56036 RepID=A0AAD1YKB1_9LAMI|nr:unnamed protein product [Fraxinus pennsylvanica]